MSMVDFAFKSLSGSVGGDIRVRTLPSNSLTFDIESLGVVRLFGMLNFRGE